MHRGGESPKCRCKAEDEFCGGPMSTSLNLVERGTDTGRSAMDRLLSPRSIAMIGASNHAYRIGGLIFATVSTLLFVPVVYAAVHRRFASLNHAMARDYASGAVSAQAFCDFYIGTLAGRRADEWQYWHGMPLSPACSLCENAIGCLGA